MALDFDRLISWPVPVVEQNLTIRDSILYALGVGLGCEPTNPKQLSFLYEIGLKALPTMATVLGHPGFWLQHHDTGVDWKHVVHGEQGLRIHKPLPVQGALVGTTKITDIIDKGPSKGALMYQEREVRSRESGDLICTLTTTTVCRADGGFGGPTGPTKQPHQLPDREPEAICDLPTLPQAALIYRLSGDYNPLHVDPDIAAMAGFERPILHGLCTFGVAGHAILRTYGDYQSDSIVRMDARFSAPVYPGETIRTEMWRDGNVVSFRSRSKLTDAIVLNNGFAELA